jgi:hypothetical protein
VASAFKLVGQEPIAELGVVGVRVGQVGVLELAWLTGLASQA